VDLSAWDALPGRALLFGEGQGRIVVSTSDASVVLALAGERSVPARQIGTVRPQSRELRIAAGGTRIAVPLDRLAAAYHGAIPQAMGPVAVIQAAEEPSARGHSCKRSYLSSTRLAHMCGIVGVRGHPQAAELTRLGLYSLQHRGQESAGIVVVDDTGQARSVRALGLVSDGLDTIRWAPWTATWQSGIRGTARPDPRRSRMPSQPWPFSWRPYRARPQRQHHQCDRAADRAGGPRVDLQLDNGLRGARAPARHVDLRTAPRSSPTRSAVSRGRTACSS